MTFLNGAILVGLVAAALPVIIHLLNRRKARIVDWGAMRFLELSLATRGRRILVEEVLLLLLRTLLVAALVLALARPLLVNEYFAGPGATGQDVVIVLDGSMSMSMRPPVGGEAGKPSGPEAPAGEQQVSYFDLARQAADQAIDRLAPGDSVAVLLGGSTARPLTEGLTFDRDAARAAVKAAQPTEGSLNVPQTLTVAGKMVQAGRNAHKQVLLITDGRSHGWRADSADDWRAVSSALTDMKQPPRVRVLCLAGSKEASAGEDMVNLAIESVRLSRPVVGTDLPVVLMVDVRNTGRAPAGDNVQLAVRLDPASEHVADRKPVGSLAPGSGSSVQLQVKFDKPGPYRLTFELEHSDLLPADNKLIYAIEVLRSLPVLLVNGDPSPVRQEDECRFLQAAFQPATTDPVEEPIEFLVAPKVVELPLLAGEELDKYFAIVLANVPRLDEEIVERLKGFVSSGGGLLVAPGNKIDRDFYNAVLFAEGQGLLPAALAPACEVVQSELKSAASRPDGQQAAVMLLPPVHGHPAFARTGALENWETARVYRRYPLLSKPGEAIATVLRLTDGGPANLGAQGSRGSENGEGSEGSRYAAEKSFGRGRVVLLGGPLDVDWSNMLLCQSPIAAINELVYYLSAPRRTQLNVAAGAALVAPAPDPLATARVRTPGGQEIDVACKSDGGGPLQFRHLPVIEPGVYEMSVRPGRTDGVGDQSAGPLFFTVQRDAGESLMPLLDTKSQGESQGLLAGSLTFHEDQADFLRSLQVTDPGREIWKWVAAAVLVMLLLEIWLSGRITRGRRGETPADGGIKFGATGWIRTDQHG